MLTDYVATRWYRAPELLLGNNSYERSVDVWAIACIMGELTDGQPLFPGESEIDQLYVIQKVMGPLTAWQTEAFHKNPRYIGLKFPEISRPEGLEYKYKGKMDRQALSFMQSLLRMEPSERLTAGEALLHPYFDSVREFQRPQTSVFAKNKQNFSQKPKGRNQLPNNHTPTEIRRSNAKLKNDHSMSPPPVHFKEASPENKFDIRAVRKHKNKIEEAVMERQRSKEQLKVPYEHEHNRFKYPVSRNKKRSFCEDNHMFNIYEEEISPKPKPKKKYHKEPDRGQSRGFGRGNLRPVDNHIEGEEFNTQQSARQLPSIHQHLPNLDLFHRRADNRINQRPREEDPDTGGGPQFMVFGEDTFNYAKQSRAYNYDVNIRR